MKRMITMLLSACLTTATSYAQNISTEDSTIGNSATQDGSQGVVQDNVTGQDRDSESLTGDSKSDLKTETATVEIPETLKFKMKAIDGKEVDLAQYAGKVVLIVNTASRCGMTPQYKDLQMLHEKYSEKGLVILGFPCNQFGGQEPGSEAEIKSFCDKNYGVKFDMFAKVDVKGKQVCDLFKLLTTMDVKPAGAGDVRWNFEKFVLDKSGQLIARYGSRVRPDSSEIVDLLESELAK
jgi:glutathione peroxidase